MVPTSYTINEAVNYLRQEVLRESAETLGWKDLVKPIILPPEVKTVSAHTSTTITVSALANKIPVDSSLVFEDGYFRTTSVVANAGATSITFTPALTTEDPDGKKVLIHYAPNQPAVPNQKFIDVVDEVLRQMNIENIEELNFTNIRIFRLLARLELLRRMTENRTTKYDARATWFDEDRNFAERTFEDTPSLISQQLFILYDYETAALGAELVVPAEETPVPVRGVPQESLSQSSGVKITW